MQPRPLLNCLGYPTLYSAAGEPIKLRSRKHLAVLVFLAVDGHMHCRDELLQLLWPDTSESEARHSLSTALSVLRRRLGPAVIRADPLRIGVDRAHLLLDVQRLLAGDVLGSETSPPLDVAAFLDGFDLTKAPDFMIWKDQQQARLLPHIKSGLVTLMDRCRRTSNSRMIEQLADRMLALDELSEEGVRAKMEARAFDGDRLEALRVFESWKSKVADEFGAEPSPALETMAGRLRRRNLERSDRDTLPPVRTDQWKTRPFVGRGAEHQVLYEAWEQVPERIPAHAWVLGESGVGKSTLVERLTTAAALQGAVVSRVQCYDLERSIPYAALAALLDGLLDRPGSAGTSPQALATLARTVPRVKERYAVQPAPSEGDGETARLMLVESSHALLHSVSEEQPVILVVDDAHNADEASLTVLHLLLRKSEGMALMVIFIGRPEEVAKSPQASRLRESTAARRPRELSVPPLTREESELMLDSLLVPDAPPPSPSTRRALLDAASGFPMVLELLVKDWQEAGEHSLALSLRAITTNLAPGGGRADPYGPLVERITQTLDQASTTVLQLAAVLGHRLNSIRAYTAIGLSLTEVMNGLTQLAAGRVLRDVGTGLEFVNELLRARVYLATPSTVRTALHGRVAEWLIAAEGDRAEAGLEIAWHCVRGERVSEVPRYLLAGAREAVLRGGLHEAERSVRSARGVLHGADLAASQLLLAELLQEQGRWRESVEVLGAMARTDGEFSVPIYRLLQLNAERRLEQPPPDEMQAMLDEVLGIHDRDDGVSVRAHALQIAAGFIASLKIPGRATPVLERAEALHERQMNDMDKARLTLAHAMTMYHARDMRASFMMICDGIRRLEAEGRVNSILVQLHIGAGAIHASEGSYEKALEHYTIAGTKARLLGTEALVTSAGANRVLCEARLGNYAAAIAQANELFESGVLNVMGSALQTVEGALFAMTMLGRARDVMALIERTRPAFATSTAPWMRQTWQLLVADALKLIDRPREAFAAGRNAVWSDVGVTEMHGHQAPGPYVRWLLETAASDRERVIAEDRLSVLAGQLCLLDSVDRVEVLSLVLRRHGTEEWREAMRLEVVRAPDAVRTQLVMLGVLSRTAP